MAINYENIINGTPSKRIKNAYDFMKSNYTKESAEEFKNAYEKEPLSSIIENSRLIFSEPYFGLPFFESVILNPKYCQFGSFDTERGKLKFFIEENSSNMNDTQKNLYEEALEKANDLCSRFYNQRIISSFINNSLLFTENEGIEEKLGDILYEGKFDEIIPLFNDKVGSYDIEGCSVLLYAPYINECTEGTSYNMNSYICENFRSTNVGWVDYVNRTAIMNKLYEDQSYINESTNLSPNARMILYSYGKEKLSDKLEELKEESVKSNDMVFHKDSKSAVLSVFDDMLEAKVYESENYRTKLDMFITNQYALSANLGIIGAEYAICENTSDIAKGYTFLDKEYSVDDLYKTLSDEQTKIILEKEDLINKGIESIHFFEEVEDEDVTDEDIDSLDVKDDDDDKSSTKKVSNNSSSVNKSAVKDTSKDKKQKENNKEEDPGIKKDIDVSPDRRKPKMEKQPFANRIQTKAQDIQVKQLKAMGKAKKNMQAIGNAAKAVTTIPKNIINSIKDTIHKLDNADDERRKDYMTEPGFRKKIFRNVKLAILYGSAASYKLSAVPMVMLVRYFSKEKDARIKNELQRELRTNIKVCEAKIQDAESEGNKQEKYRLIRIKDQLENEMARVAYNSKYI